MRHVAVAFVALLLAAALPATAQSFISNECRGLSAPDPCHTVTPPAQASGSVGTYYLYAAAAKCVPSFDADCSGRTKESQRTAPLNLAGVLWEETNGLSGGLQRFEEYHNGVRYPPDKMILV